ncbi:MAG: protein kinase [Acidobacteriota bacterium]|jgi:serine/threonine-protein kinase
MRDSQPLIGQTLAHYRITAAIGSGGMGEVYRAADTKLGRDVALKVLPAEVAENAERLGRFERETHLLAALNHPNVGAIYGLEEAEGKPFLVLELVEGEELQQRLERGPIPIEEAIEIARQIAEGLEAAHDKGVVHRDLKPANVKLTPDGKVKVLDFGLAKAWAGDPVTGSSSDLSQSPTLAHTGTQAGVILGTAAYMSPEQARGKAVDRRADVWAFGAVLWEMLTGRQLFAGDTVSDIVAAVLTREPDWTALPARTPASVRGLLRRALERNPRRRLQAIGEARLVLEDPGAAPATETIGTPAGRSWRTIAAVAVGISLFAAGWLLRPTPPKDEAAVRKVDLLATRFQPGLGQTPVISPGGDRVAFFAEGGLRVRPLDGFDVADIADTDGVLYPAWSPDGSQLVYVRQGRAWKAPSDGGPPTALGPVPDDLAGSGASVWTEDGRVVFAGSDSVGLWEIPAGGGEGREILELDRDAESDFHELGLLPGNRGLLLTVHRRETARADTVEVLAGGSRRVVLQIPGERLRYPVYSPSGHLVYERETTSPGVWAVPFSLERLETSGVPFLVVPGGRAPTVARDGTLCFVRPDDSPLELVRVSRDGSVESVAVLAGTSMPMSSQANPGTGYRPDMALALSPDGGRLALALNDPDQHLLIYDLTRGSLSSLAADVFAIGRPVWTPDAERLVYSSAQDASTWNLATRRADASGEQERLATSIEVQVPLTLSPDGRWLVYMERANIFKRALDEPGDAHPVFPTPVWGYGASFSPDGRWLAYEDNDSGRPEVYVRPFPEGPGRWRVSTNGGSSPLWSGNGEVFYMGSDALHAVKVETRGDSLEVSKPIRLFPVGGETRLIPAFDVTPDGRQVFMVRASGQHQISLVFNWPRELARVASGAQ